VVKILSINGAITLLLCLLTFSYYKKSNQSSDCEIRILTSNSFFSGIGDDLVEAYKYENSCDLKFDVVNGANLISNLFNKQSNRYDMLIGLDIFQINKLSAKFVQLPLKTSKFIDKSLILNGRYMAYDESPLTFFIRGSEISNFENLSGFINYLELKKLTVAVPLKTTSVLGALFEAWNINDIQFENKNMDLDSANRTLNKRFNSNSIKFVKSWSEGFGLFERKIVDGFLSFETSEIYFAKTPDVKKISLKDGHPNLKEYLTFSSFSKLSEIEKNKMLDFILSEKVQNLLLEKNYMWPVNSKVHEFSEYRNLKIKSLDMGVN
jgi:ABC-type thiamine transport system substrate-binding protein